MPYDAWLKENIEHPQVVPDAYFVAVKGHEYVGLGFVKQYETVEMMKRLRDER